MVTITNPLGLVRDKEIVVPANKFNSLQDALDEADSITEPGHVKRVLAPNTYNTEKTLLIGNETILDGGMTGRIVKNNTNSFKIITNKGALDNIENHGIGITSIDLEGTPADGAEQNAGIHYSKTIDSFIDNVIIRNVRGDGITIGNITGGVIQTCKNVHVSNNKIVNSKRQGIALTDADSCTVKANNISDTNASTVGIGIDLEPNFTGQFIQNNLVINNIINNTNWGIVGASVANVSGESRGNHISNNLISNVNIQGIKYAYDFAIVSENIIKVAGQFGIYIVNSAGQLQGIIVSNNSIIDAGQTTDNTYAGIEAENVIHSVFSNNVFYSTLTNKINKLWNESGSSAYNTWTGNNGRQLVKPYTIASSSNASHNMLNLSAITNRHEGFTAMGRIDHVAATAGTASLRMPHGATPTTPVNGDMWTTTNGIFVHINGATRQISTNLV